MSFTADAFQQSPTHPPRTCEVYRLALPLGPRGLLHDLDWTCGQFYLVEGTSPTFPPCVSFTLDALPSPPTCFPLRPCEVYRLALPLVPGGLLQDLNWACGQFYLLLQVSPLFVVNLAAFLPFLYVYPQTQCGVWASPSLYCPADFFKTWTGPVASSTCWLRGRCWRRGGREGAPAAGHPELLGFRGQNQMEARRAR